MAEELKPVLTDVFTEPATDEGDDLIEEMASTSVINDEFDSFTDLVTTWFMDLKYTSEQGNPVKTHIELVSTEEDILTELSSLRARLIEALANRSETVVEKGGLLRKQVVGDED